MPHETPDLRFSEELILEALSRTLGGMVEVFDRTAMAIMSPNFVVVEEDDPDRETGD